MQHLYREGLNNWLDDKEAAQIFCPGTNGIALEQDVSKGEKFAAKLTQSETNCSITSGICSWFAQNRRSFPWREEKTPYRIWISEVMLQQTRASVVIPYFIRWMEQFPNIQALAEAPLETVIKAWEGLGYYSRARNLHAGAKQIVEQFDGEIPDSKEALLSIRGLGPYTIGAILSFGFYRKAVAIDGNVARVVSRYVAFEENICKAKGRRFLEEATEKLLEGAQPWVTMEALIELGATLCQPKPRCGDCPLQKNCLGFQKGLAETLPIKNASHAIQPLFRAVAVLEADGRFLISKGKRGKVMADLYEFPFWELQREGISFEEVEKKVKQRFEIRVKSVKKGLRITHSFTRYKAYLFPFFLKVETAVEIERFIWVDRGQLLSLPFSSGHRKIVEQLCTSSI